MFWKPKSKTELEIAIDVQVKRLVAMHPCEEDFAKSVDQITKLHKMKEAEKPSSLSRDTLILCATNIAGIVMIIRHEEFNNITSKALSFVIKPKA